MREFKFRVWCKGKSDNPNFNKQKWFDINDIILNKYITIRALFNGADDNFVVQQYTGLTDKNNKEIYEGDIVKSIFNDEVALVDFNDKNYASVLGWNLLSIGYFEEGKLIFNDPKIQSDGKLPAVEYFYGRSPGKNWEIIGNIYGDEALING
jgi:uncharacterized phage protein (TIGR01671 family)